MAWPFTGHCSRAWPLERYTRHGQPIGDGAAISSGQSMPAGLRIVSPLCIRGQDALSFRPVVVVEPACRTLTSGDDVVEHPQNPSNLLARAEAGEEEAWNQLVERFTDLLWSICRSFRLDDQRALDVVQTTWLRLVESLGRINHPDRLAGWLATTTRRECINALRRTGREAVGWADIADSDVLGDTDLFGGIQAEVDLALLTEERDSELRWCFSQLSERCQRLLRVLMATDRPAYVEVSGALGVPVGSIGPTRIRCLSRLREIAAAAGCELALTDDRSSG
jgi:RNA polymerase sigma factor (sigma-70 family)